MRSTPCDDYDQKRIKELNAEPWMIELLDLNPSYTCWGPHEDYMAKKEGGWDSVVEFESWKDFKWELDELNEVVNFYFEVSRQSEACKDCDQGGYNPETRKIADNFYDYSSSTGKGWHDQITQDECDALVEAGRLRTHKPVTGWEKNVGLKAETVNAANGPGSMGFGDLNHDGINRHILIETRAKRLGVYGHCVKCEGNGYYFTAPEAHVGLVLWMLHPRKGCSRGVEIKRVDRTDLPTVQAFLKQADERNAKRFKMVREAKFDA